MTIQPRADVLVAGAGPAGAATVFSLRRRGVSVLWVDPSPPADRVIGEALIGAAVPVLRDLGLCHLLQDRRHQVCPGNVSSWGSAAPVTRDFLRDPNGPGYHLDRAGFDAALRSAAIGAGAALRRERVETVRRCEQGYEVQLSAGVAHCRVLVDATGRSSALARRLGACRRRDEALLAVYAWYRGGDDEDRRTWIEATPQGWWYAALLADGGRTVAFHTDQQVARKLLSEQALWDDLLAQTTFVRQRVAGAHIAGALRATDASGSVLEPSCGVDWLAVGDAALSFEPLSAQGLFTALYTALRGAQAVCQSLAGDGHALPRYQQRLAAIRQVYEHNVAAAYDAELRWTERLFWRSRCSDHERQQVAETHEPAEVTARCLA